MALAILLLVIGLGLTVTVSARPPDRGPDYLTRLEDRLEGLGLDKETQTAIHTTIDAARAERRELRRQLGEAYGDLRALLEQDTPDEAAVLAQAEVIGTFETALRKHAMRTLLAVRALLTPEQRASLRQAIQGRGAWRHGRER
jgi:Spy/CpxP family protein refolding chaperone